MASDRGVLLQAAVRKAKALYPKNRARPTILLPGTTFGRLTVVERVRVEGTWRYLCSCTCGGTTVTYGWCLTKGVSSSCGCVRSEKGLDPGRAGFLIALRGYRRGASQRGLSFDLSEEEVASLMGRCCHYCGTPPSRIVHSPTERGRFLCGGIDRVDNSAGYTSDNVVPACTQCNRAKSNTTVEEFLSQAARVHFPECPVVHSITPSGAEVSRFNGYIDASRRRGIEHLIGCSLFASYFRMPCAYCGMPPSGKGYGGSRHSGVDRVDNEVGYEAGNLLPCCSWCNYAKRDMSLLDFIAWASRLQAYQATLTQSTG